jgi:hypothetical protein
VALGNVDIFIQSRPEVDHYFPILMPDPPIGWRRAWFLLRNDANAPLPAFTGSCPISEPNWGYGVAQTDLHRLQPLLEVIRGLLQKGLKGTEVLRIFFSRGVQPLHGRVVIVQMHPTPSCPDSPFSVKSGCTEIDTGIRRVLAPRADWNLGSGTTPLRERVDNLWVSLLALVFS